ncbi:MAG: class I SAM-dependent methyltransferase [Bacillota bacterium]
MAGIEISEEALKPARRLGSWFRYHRGSVLDVPPFDEAFDAIYCFNVLHLFRQGDRRLFPAGRSTITPARTWPASSATSPSWMRGSWKTRKTRKTTAGRVHMFTWYGTSTSEGRVEPAGEGLMRSRPRAGTGQTASCPPQYQ